MNLIHDPENETNIMETELSQLFHHNHCVNFRVKDQGNNYEIS